VELLQEVLLGDGGLVQGVHYAVVLQVLDERLGDDRVVVAVVEGAGTREEVDIAVALVVVEERAFGHVEHRGEGPDIAADLGFKLFENSH